MTQGTATTKICSLPQPVLCFWKKTDRRQTASHQTRGKRVQQRYGRHGYYERLCHEDSSSHGIHRPAFPNRTCWAHSCFACLHHSVPALQMCFRKGWMLFSSCLQFIGDPHNCSKILIPVWPCPRDVWRKRKPVSLLSSQEKRHARLMQEDSITKVNEPGSSASPTYLNHFTVTFDGSCSGGGLERKKISQQMTWYIQNYSVMTVR